MAAPEKAQSQGNECRTGERRELDALFSLVYEELRRLASFVRRSELNATINSTALLHEAWLKLKDSRHVSATSPAHFKAIAARAMRQVLVDEARRRSARKRGGSGEAVIVTLSDGSAAVASCDEELLALDEALEELARLNSRQARIIELRFFSGLSVADTSEVLGVSESAVERDWRAAKAWLATRIRPETE